MSAQKVFDDLMVRLTSTPKPGDVVYVPGGDDWIGGRATIVKVESGTSGGETMPFVVLQELPNQKWNWIYLAADQVHLRNRFGDTQVHYR